MVRTKDIVAFLSGHVETVLGDTDREVAVAAPVWDATAAAATFYTGTLARLEERSVRCQAGVVLCRAECADFLHEGPGRPVAIVVAEPRLSFLRVVERFFTKARKTGIHPTAVIGESVEIGLDVHVGAYAVIEDGCRIGDGCSIGGHVHLYEGTCLGRNVLVHAGTAIGGDGFGYHRNEQGELEKFPHLGGVLIGDDVEIGSNTSIDRGTLGDTVIGRGSKIDNQVHIAHNVVLGENCAVIAQAMIGGSTRIGDGSWIAPSAVLRDGLVLGRNVTVGLGAIVVKDVEDGCTVMGSPARDATDFKRLMRAQARLVSQE